MRRHLPSLLFLAIALAGATTSAMCAKQTNKMETFMVHGRLSIYNGNPSHRIWIVGTKRLLGVRESADEVPFTPAELRSIMTTDREVFADFVIEPLMAYKQGHMQMVRVVSVSKIVVTERGKIVLQKDKL
jgi:hypothetical protein